MIADGWVIKTQFGYVKQVGLYEKKMIAECTDNLAEAKLFITFALADRIRDRLQGSTLEHCPAALYHGRPVPRVKEENGGVR